MLNFNLNVQNPLNYETNQWVNSYKLCLIITKYTNLRLKMFDNFYTALNDLL